MLASQPQIGLGLVERVRRGLARKARTYLSFYEFVQKMWDVIIPEEPVWNWHIKVICDEMQAVAERVFKGEAKLYDLVINVPPGATKSSVCSIMFPAWVWTRMPTARTICGSYSKQLALELSRKSRDVVKSDEYQNMFGALRLQEDQNTKGHFVNDKNGSRFATSTGGAVTGFHAHFIVVDDPLNPKEAVSDADLRTAHSWIGQTLSTRKVDKRVTPTILIMQRLHEDDPAGRMIEEGRTGARHIRHINLPAEIDERNRQDVRPRGLRKLYKPDPDKQGSFLLDPVRIPRDVLEEFKSDNLLGEYGYAGQMLQRPVPFGGGLFKIDLIHVHEVAPAKGRFRQVVRFWDKAGTEGGGAYSVGLELGEDVDGEYWFLDVERKQMDTGTRERTIRQTAEIDGHGVTIGIEQEPGSGGKESAENTVKNLAGFSVVVVRPTGDKTVRAIPFSAQVNVGNVHMVAGEWNRELLKELELFPMSKYKDQVDAASGAFTVLTQGPRVGVIK